MICALRVLCNLTERRKNMMESVIIPIFGVLILQSCSALSTPNPNTLRARRGISNPIFSRVFNPYDNRPLPQKFFGDDYAPQPVQYDSPQYYSLWDRQPVLKEVDSEEDRGEYFPRNFGKPYPPPSHPYPEPAKPSTWKPYPAASKPYSEPITKPYPAASKPYPEPITKPYPEPNKPQVNPCPEPSKPYPGPQKPHRRPAFGRLFVDEVDKDLHFERNPITGQLVPVITEGRRSTQNQYGTSRFEEGKETERTTTVKAVVEDKTEREYQFKLLPNYDIKTKFDKSNDEQSNAYTKDDQRVNKLEKTKHKILREFYGSDETKWPQNPLETLLEQLKNSQKSHHEPTFIVTSTGRPSIVLLSQEVRRKVQDERPRVETFSVPKPTKKPCLNKTTKRPFQLRFPQVVSTERPVKINIRVKVSNVTKPQPFSFRITPHNPRVSEDYTQFLAPPASVIYQKFNGDDQFLNVEPFTSPTPTEIISHLSKQDQSITSYTAFQTSRTPPKGLQFRVFNNKLDQSVLEGLKDPETGKVDPSELEKITHRVFVEPLNRKEYNEVRKQLQTLDSRKLNIFNEYVAENKDRYDFNSGSFSILGSPGPKSPSDDHRVSGRKFFDNRRFFSKFDEKSKYLEQDLNPKNIFNVGDIPLDRQEIWDGDRRVLTDSYGKLTSTK